MKSSVGGEGGGGGIKGGRIGRGPMKGGGGGRRGGGELPGPGIGTAAGGRKWTGADKGLGLMLEAEGRLGLSTALGFGSPGSLGSCSAFQFFVQSSLATIAFEIISFKALCVCD
jgi:hypothetical protein